jgi:uncharacterized protein with von Willebrand factor type A (vWA) domain
MTDDRTDEQTNHDWWTGLTQAAPADERGMAGGETPDAQEVQAAKPAPKSAQAVQHSPFDGHLYSRVLEDVSAFRQTVEGATREYDAEKAGPLARDVFASLYKMAPELTDEGDMDPAFARHHAALQEMMATGEYKQLWALTQMDELSAAVAAATMTRNVVRVLKKQEEKNPTPPAGEQDDDAQDPGQGGQQDAPGGQGQPSGQGQPGQSGSERMELRVAAREAAQAAQQDVQAARDAEAAFGGGKDMVGPGWGHATGQEGSAGTIQSRAALAQTVLQSARLRRIAAIAGRMKVMAAAAQKRRTKDKADEVVGITTGDDLSRALPSELMMLRHPKMRALVMRDILEGSMLQYEMAGVEKKGKGPIILAVDESGSMFGARSEWAMGIFLALLSIAAKQGRDLRLIHFGAAGAYDWQKPDQSFTTPHKNDELRVVDFKKGQAQPATVMTEALHFYNGGTDYHIWMRSALEAIGASEYKEADVIVVTDDECTVTPNVLAAWTEAKKAKQFRCLGILVAGTGSNVLRDLCDELHFVAAPGHNDRDALMATFSV